MALEKMSFENVTTTDGRRMPVYTLSSPMSLRLRWAKDKKPSVGQIKVFFNKNTGEIDIFYPKNMMGWQIKNDKIQNSNFIFLEGLKS